MNLFYPNKNPTSYKPAIIRIFAYIGIILLLMFRGKFGVPSNFWLGILCVVLGVFCLYGIFYAITEMIDLSDAREEEQKKKTGRNAKTKLMDISKIIELLKSNDVIEISLLVDKKVMFIGTRSDYDRWTEKFFDKQYYIDDAVYTSAEELQNALYPYTTAGLLNVISIE